MGEYEMDRMIMYGQGEVGCGCTVSEVGEVGEFISL